MRGDVIEAGDEVVLLGIEGRRFRLVGQAPVTLEYDPDADVMVGERMVNPLEGGVGEDDARPVRPVELPQDPVFIAPSLGLVPLDLRTDLIGREPAGWCFEHVDLPDPALDVILAQEIVEEQERDLIPHPWWDPFEPRVPEPNVQKSR